MNAEDVRKHAKRHGRAMVAGDVATAGADLTPEARSAAKKVMEALPAKLDGAEVTGVDARGGDYVAVIRYAGEGREVTVESVWRQQDGRPMIGALRVL